MIMSTSAEWRTPSSISLEHIPDILPICVEESLCWLTRCSVKRKRIIYQFPSEEQRTTNMGIEGEEYAGACFYEEQFTSNKIFLTVREDIVSPLDECDRTLVFFTLSKPELMQKTEGQYRMRRATEVHSILLFTAIIEQLYGAITNVNFIHRRTQYIHQYRYNNFATSPSGWWR